MARERSGVPPHHAARISLCPNGKTVAYKMSARAYGAEALREIELVIHRVQAELDRVQS
jgi:hypothetical protein